MGNTKSPPQIDGITVAIAALTWLSATQPYRKAVVSSGGTYWRIVSRRYGSPSLTSFSTTGATTGPRCASVRAAGATARGAGGRGAATMVTEGEEPAGALTATTATVGGARAVTVVAAGVKALWHAVEAGATNVVEVAMARVLNGGGGDEEAGGKGKRGGGEGDVVMQELDHSGTRTAEITCSRRWLRRTERC